MNTIQWAEWQKAAQAMYRPLGWPRSEMREHFEAGLTPQQAVDAAHARRKLRDARASESRA